MESLLTTAIILSGLAALGSVTTLIVTLIHRNRNPHIDVKLPDGTIRRLDSSLTPEQMQSEIEKIVGKVFHQAGRPGTSR
jgi:hypothetical protein